MQLTLVRPCLYISLLLHNKHLPSSGLLQEEVINSVKSLGKMCGIIKDNEDIIKALGIEVEEVPHVVVPARELQALESLKMRVANL